MIHGDDCGSNPPMMEIHTQGVDRARSTVVSERWVARVMELGYEDPRDEDIGSSTVYVCVHVYLQLLRGIYIYISRSNNDRADQKETMQWGNQIIDG